MKRLWAFFAAAMICALITGCGNQKELAVDIDTMAADLAERVSYQDDIVPVESAVAGMFYELPEGIESMAIYMGSGATAEEVSVFEAKDEETAQKMEDAAKKHIEKQQDAFEGYIPEEVKRLEKAIVRRKGRYVAVCVTDDTENAKEIIDRYLK